MFPLLIFPALCARTTTSLHSSKGGLRTRVDSSFYVSSILDPVHSVTALSFATTAKDGGICTRKIQMPRVDQDS